MCAMKTLYKLAAVKYEFMSLNSTQFGPIFIRQLDGMSMNAEKKAPFIFIIMDESVNFE